MRLCSAIPHLTPPPSTSTHTQTSQTLVPINTHICQYAQIHTFTEEKSQQSVQQSIHIQISRYRCANRPFLKAQVPNLILGPKVLVAIHICRRRVVFDFVRTSQHSFPPPLNRTPSPRPALELLFPDCTSTYPPPINRAHSVFYFFYQHKPLIVNIAPNTHVPTPY